MTFHIVLLVVAAVPGLRAAEGLPHCTLTQGWAAGGQREGNPAGPTENGDTPGTCNCRLQGTPLPRTSVLLRPGRQWH